MFDSRQLTLTGLARSAGLAAIPMMAMIGATFMPAVGTQASEYVTAADRALVATNAGKLLGAERNGVFQYLGTPYATAERFMMPQKVESWEGIRPAVTYGNNCLIPPMSEVANDELFNPHRYLPMSENCQFLNIWTPGVNDGGNRPVMVWLHGGGFTNGSAIEQVAYDGENLAKKGDVVVVTLNHRLNILGFLDLSAYGPDYADTPNLGLMDTVAALEWVRDNIEAFGGDPDNVTIFGQSGGGGKVRALMRMPAADGLFHKAIVQSGATNVAGMPKEAASRVAELTLGNLGLTAETADKIREVSYEDLLAAGTQAFETLSQENAFPGVTGWRAVIDGVQVLQDENGGDGWVDQGRDIPLLIGNVLNESETVIRNKPADLLADNKNQWAEEYAREKLKERFGDKADAVAEAFLAAYPDKTLADAYFVDLRSRPGTLRNAKMKAEQGGAPVYTYMFSWESPVLEGIGMAWHCAEIPHVFANAELVNTATGGGPDAIAMSERVSDAWIAFARTGNPNHEGLPEWPAYTVEGGATMIFDNVSEVRFNHDTPLLEAAGAI